MCAQVELVDDALVTFGDAIAMGATISWPVPFVVGDQLEVQVLAVNGPVGATGLVSVSQSADGTKTILGSAGQLGVTQPPARVISRNSQLFLSGSDFVGGATGIVVMCRVFRKSAGGCNG